VSETGPAPKPGTDDTAPKWTYVRITELTRQAPTSSGPIRGAGFSVWVMRLPSRALTSNRTWKEKTPALGVGSLRFRVNHQTGDGVCLINQQVPFCRRLRSRGHGSVDEKLPVFRVLVTPYLLSAVRNSSVISPTFLPNVFELISHLQRNRVFIYPRSAKCVAAEELRALFVERGRSRHKN